VSASPARQIAAEALDAYRGVRRAVLRFTGPIFRAWLEKQMPDLGEWPAFTSKQVHFHSWRPGFFAEPQSWPVEAPDLDAITLRAMVDFPAIQNPLELRQWLARVAAARPRTVVEIGTGAGGMFYALAQLAHEQATLVSIDVPGGGYGGGHSTVIDPVLRAFAGPEQRIEIIRDRSFHYSTRSDLMRILDGKAIDLLFIDGDHSYGGVRADFEMYAPLCAPDGIIALHDICVTPENSGRGFDVGIYWRELAATRAAETIVASDAVPGLITQATIPAAERRAMAFGIGILRGAA
jgi:predicted O-methyltransferase YrrM